ncbi:hypothetical protein R1sor_021707 [Riccia sorocarpa]|uniref:Uncharacterized protein n=1 Tax=Riccia sorocarpa TaxID=122646 RepID=A0ABD3GJH2_9MARC
MESFDEWDLVQRGLTTAEWKAELHAVQCNSSWNEFKLFVDDVDPELLKIRGKLLGQCLSGVQNIRTLTICLLSPASSSSLYLSELVSGLKLNPHPSIDNLSIRYLKKSNDTTYVSEIIRHVTELQELSFIFCDWEGFSEDAAGSLASSIAGAVQLNLNALLFWGNDDSRGLSELLRKIFLAETDSGRRYLPKFDLFAMDIFSEELWGVFPVLASNISSTFITFFGEFSATILWWEAFADALKSSPVMSIDIQQDPSGIEDALRSSRVLPMYIQPITRHRVVAAGTFSILYSKRHSSVLLAVPRRIAWERVFLSLKSNTSVTSLDLSGRSLTDVHFEQLRSLLRVNLTIQEVKLEHTSWRNDGKASVIEETLVRNKKAATEFSILNAAGFEIDKAKVGRIFLCGSPYAGKTQLKLRMMRLYHKRSSSASKPGRFSDSFWERLKRLELRRTKGAEVEVLIDNKERQVFLWDLAGQYIFRALHDLIFPRRNQSMIFIFAFNPLQADSKEIKKDVYDAFALELEEWLKFVASNCQTGDSEHLPEILVVITHKDLMDKYPKSFECGPGSIVLKIVERFEFTFQGVVRLVPKVYHVDARARKDVRPFLDHILVLMDNWSKVHSVLVVCSDISSELLDRAKSFSASPVWSISTFYRFCREFHKSLKSASPEILSTVASYLHDAGRIIIVPEYSGSKIDEPWVIVDPNWCTETFLGTMIALGNHFDVRGASCSGSTVFTSSDGFIDEHDFQRVLQQTLDLMKGEGIERRLLEDLLQRLNLCYRCEDGVSCRYFVPIICGELGERCDLRERKLQWADDHTEGCQYLGYRLQCKETETTSFNKAVFSRFQIDFRRELMKQFGIKETDRGICCGLGLLTVMYDGYEVFVESDEVNGQHVDIMVKSSQPGVKNPRTRMQIISFLQEHFLRKLHRFYASSSGSPGISLVVGVIRTSSVRHLVPIRERRASQHSIALEEWKNKFRLSIDHKFQIDMGAEVDDESLLSFQYKWPDGELELVKDTLGSEDLTDILSYVRDKRIIAQNHEVMKLSDEVYEIYAPLNDYPRLEVVFVHGVPEDESDPKAYLTMWSKRNKETDCWLNTWLTSETEDLRLGRVLTVSYDCGVEKKADNGNMDSFQVAENLTQSLIKWARVGQQSCPVILVGHGLGGLVIKELCCEASRNVEAQNHHAVECRQFLKNVKGIFYYSTPHLGWYQSFSSEVKTGDMMECLQILNKYASRVNFQFEQLRRIYRWRTRGVGESNPTKNLLSRDSDSAMKKLIVEEASARAGTNHVWRKLVWRKLESLKRNVVPLGASIDTLGMYFDSRMNSKSMGLKNCLNIDLVFAVLMKVLGVFRRCFDMMAMLL